MTTVKSEKLHSLPGHHAQLLYSWRTGVFGQGSQSSLSPKQLTNVIDETRAISLLDDFQSSDPTTTIQGEALAPARHSFWMNASSNSHGTAVVRRANMDTSTTDSEHGHTVAATRLAATRLGLSHCLSALLPVNPKHSKLINSRGSHSTAVCGTTENCS